MDVVAVVGLGYGELPLAVAFGKIMPTIGYDLALPKLEHYRQHMDPSGALSETEMRAATPLTFTADAHALEKATFIIVAVPTPKDVPDLRNSKVWDLIAELRAYGVEVFVHDPVADEAEALHEYGIALSPWDALPQAYAVVVAVAHQAVLSRPTVDFSSKMKPRGCFVDVKARFDTAALHAAGFNVWRL